MALFKKDKPSDERKRELATQWLTLKREEAELAKMRQENSDEMYKLAHELLVSMEEDELVIVSLEEAVQKYVDRYHGNARCEIRKIKVT
jgi:hypothetical protein